MPEIIDSFAGKYRFLSNFFKSPILLHGKYWPTVEHIFQAAKTLNEEERKEIRQLKIPSQAKKKGSRVKLRSDWEDIKKNIMLKCVRLKFKQNQHLQERLLDTGDAFLVEGNTWHDNFWGDCQCLNCMHFEGKNHLGFILMQVRKELSKKNEVKIKEKEELSISPH